MHTSTFTNGKQIYKYNFVSSKLLDKFCIHLRDYEEVTKYDLLSFINYNIVIQIGIRILKVELNIFVCTWQSFTFICCFTYYFM